MPKATPRKESSSKGLKAKTKKTSQQKPTEQDTDVIQDAETKPSAMDTSNADATAAEGPDHSQEQPGMTLPPLALDGDDWDWGDNTLPPLLDWEEMGI